MAGMHDFIGGLDEWERALSPHGVSESQLPSVVAALRERGIEAFELRELVEEYPHLAPHAPRAFPGFGYGDEREIAAELEGVREKLRDPSRRRRGVSEAPPGWYD